MRGRRVSLLRVTAPEPEKDDDVDATDGDKETAAEKD